MNPFLSLLILVPLTVSLILSFAFLGVLIVDGLRTDIVVGLLLTGGLSAYLGFLFRKTLTKKGALLETPGLENISDQEKRSLTNLNLFSAFLGLTLYGLVFWGYEVMKGVAGAVFLLMGVFLIWSSIVVGRSVNSVTETAEFLLNRALYPRHKKIYFFFVATLGVLLTLLYQFAPSWHFISPWDIAGILFFLASTCVWLAFLDRKQQKDLHTVK